MVKHAFDDEPLSEETIKAIEESMEDIKSGRAYYPEKIAEEFGLKE